MPEPTSEQLGFLLELQSTDTTVRRLEHQLDALPEQQRLDAANDRARELRREHDDLRVELERAAAEQRQLEREADVLTTRRDAERARLYDGTVANAREAKAIEAEIETTQRRLAEQEDLLLDVLERVETLESRVGGLASDLDAERKRAAELETARDEAAKGILAELGELRARRARQAESLPPELLERYEKVAQRAGGTGVATLEGNACTACRIEMSMADVGELYAGPPLTTCPQCRRLLVVPA